MDLYEKLEDVGKGKNLSLFEKNTNFLLQVVSVLSAKFDANLMVKFQCGKNLTMERCRKKKSLKLLRKLIFCANFVTKISYSTMIDLSIRKTKSFTLLWSTVRAVIYRRLLNVALRIKNK